MTDTPTICPDCRTAVVQELRAAANRHYTLANRQWSDKRTRGNAKVNRRMGTAYGWAAGILARGGLG